MSKKLCNITYRETNGGYVCSRDYGHDGPCAAHPTAGQMVPGGLPCVPDLGFDDLTRGNQKRIPLFKNAKGEIAHPKTAGIDGSDWTLLEWSGAIAGEVGELCNLTKKIRRGDVSLDDMMEDKGKMLTVRQVVAREAADAVCYLDIVCLQVGINLGDAVREKFNSVSDRIGVDVKI